MRQKIALDARRMARQSVSGIGHYVHQLASRLPALAPEFEFLLLTDRPLDADKVPSQCRQVVLGRAFAEGSAQAKAYSPFWMNCLVSRFLAREGVNLFHGTNYALPALGRVRYVVTIHDIAFVRVPETFSLFHRSYLRSLVSLGVRRANHIVVGSEAARGDLVRLGGVDVGRLSVIHHGFDDTYSPCEDNSYLTRVREQFKLPPRYLLHVGVIETKKNTETVLKACAPLIQERVVDEVVLAGRDGRGADSVRRLARQLGFEDRARFLGYVPQDAMRGVYTLARVLVFPSWFEGFGLPVLEAMACGTPVVASDSSSIPEVAGDAALLFPPHSPDALQAALRAVLSDSALRSRLIQRGLSRVRQFSWAESARRHVDVYRRVLASTSL
jgi:glycosyltransferase involved in cell wall biosynthesis